MIQSAGSSKGKATRDIGVKSIQGGARGNDGKWVCSLWEQEFIGS